MKSDHVPLEIESEGLVNKKVKEKAMKEIKRSVYTRGDYVVSREMQRMNTHTNRERQSLKKIKGEGYRINYENQERGQYGD